MVLKSCSFSCRPFYRCRLKVTLVTLLPGKPLAHEIPDGLIWIDLGQAVSAACSNRALNARVWRFVSAWTRRVGRFAYCSCVALAEVNITSILSTIRAVVACQSFRCTCIIAA